MTREANRQAFAQVVCEDRGIVLATPFAFTTTQLGILMLTPRSVIRQVGKVFALVGGLGQLSQPRLLSFLKALRFDDCLTIDGRYFVLEYDEKLHLSAFRKTTLECQLYESLRVGFDRAAYLAACGTIRLTESSKRAHIDPPLNRPNSTSPHLNFTCPTKPGECRHRQRAFYDFLKDVMLGSALPGFPGIIRISDLTDFVRGQTPGDVLDHGDAKERGALCDLLRTRARAASQTAA